MNRSFSNNEKGFSLLEIIIVMTIMGVFATIAARSIKTATNNKKKIDARLRIESSVYDTLRIISTDLEKAFHFTNPFYELDKYALTAASTKKSGTNNNANAQQVTGQQQGQAVSIPPRPPILTQFIGKENNVHFTTLNHFRTVSDSAESRQVEVGYFLKNCRPKGKKDGKSTPCLWRRSALTIDDDVTDGGKAVVLLENVKIFQLEYMSEDPNQRDWQDQWQSDRNGSSTTQGKFPQLIKITLRVEDAGKAIAAFQQTIIASVRFPNNANPEQLFKPQGANPNDVNRGNTAPPTGVN